MKKIALVLMILLVAVLLLAACQTSLGPTAVMTAYINALAQKESNQLALLSCPDYAQFSQESIDSFMAVDLSLSDLACYELENDGTNALVNCTGKLTATYNNENMDIDLSLMSYQLKKSNGDWLVCGQE